ncbi:MAG: ROK family protein [Prevotellaceae bacterium]|jgi:glucokinase|nr:ROK family protein [Prevotellaceae bacterium]
MYTIGIDLGGTIIKIGLLRNGKICDFLSLEATSPKGLASKMQKIHNEIDKILEKFHVEKNKIQGIGLAFPGIVDPVKSKVISTNKKYDDACYINLPKWVYKNWGVDFYIDNDARMATVGEWQKGAGKGLNNIVMMTLGTGIGTGVIIDGKPLYGKHFQAGSLGGHFVVDYRGRNCSCRNTGCVEAHSSSFFLPKIIAEHQELSDKFKEKAIKYDFKKLFEIYAEGNPDAILLLNECMDVWAAAIVTYIHAYDPEMVIVGGGVSRNSEIIFKYIEKKIHERVWSSSAKVPVIEAALGDHAALFGLDYFLNKNNV